MTTLYYKNSQGNVINFMGPNIFAQQPEKLQNSSWKYSTLTEVNGLSRIEDFHRELKETPLLLDIMCDSEEEFDAVMEDLNRCLEVDIETRTPGRIYWNDYYMSMYGVAQGHAEYDEYFESVEKELTILSAYPYWIKEHSFDFYRKKTVTEEKAKEYNYDLPTDLLASISNDSVTNEHYISSNFRLRIKGPCVNPAITIANHTYKVNLTINADGILEVDSSTKTIMLIRGDEKINCYKYRDKESYIFEHIPVGKSSVNWNGEFDFQLILLEERSEARWI